MKKVRAPMRPSVALSPEDAHELRVLSGELERELMRTYEDFVVRSKRVVDDRRWKHIKSQEDLHLYRERGAYKQAAGSVQPAPHASRESHDHEMEIGPQAALAANSKMPVLMGTGTLPGRIEDALYGSSFFDTRSLRARNYYARETMEENAVLAVVDGATKDDPFRFLGVIWYYKMFPIPGLMANSDILMLASTHLSQLSTGERVSVTLYHSIEHRDAPDLHNLNIQRADVSVATIYRQIDELRFECFISSFVDPKSSTPDAIVYMDSARSILTVTQVCDVALRRKLFFRMRETQKTKRQRAASGLPGLDSHREDHDDGDDDSHCALCNKKISGLFSTGSTCQICTKRVCSKCSVTKHIVIESHRTSYTAMPFDFCLVCTLETKEVPAMAVARDELYERSLAVSEPTSSSVSSSSSGSIDTLCEK